MNDVYRYVSVQTGCVYYLSIMAKDEGIYYSLDGVRWFMSPDRAVKIAGGN